MAKRGAHKATKKVATKKPIESYDHQDKKRANNPPVGLVTPETDPDAEGAFYCSQLAYKAYRQFDINLNTGKTVEGIPGTDRIVYPQEIWDGCRHTAAERDN